MAEQHAVAFYAGLGLPKIMTGWSKFSSGAIGGDTENYANVHGALSATLESGSHFDKSSNDIAYKAAVSLLSLLGMLEGETIQPSAETEIFEMYSVVLKESDDFRYAGDAGSFKFLRKGETAGISERPAPAGCRRQLPADPDETGRYQGG